MDETPQGCATYRLPKNIFGFPSPWFFCHIFIVELFMCKKTSNGEKVLTGVEVAEAKFSDCGICPFLHAMKEINEITVKIVIHLKGRHGGIAEKHAAGAAEYIDKSAVFQWK